jgi:hypothetical protein
MSLTKALERGINSATYSPEAEKALAEERKKASEAKQKYRDGLFKLRDTKTVMVQKKEATEYFIKNVDTLADDGFKWLTANPDADVQSITNQATSTSEKFQDISKANIVLLGLSVLPTFYKTIASDAFLKKQITEDKKNELDAFADSLSAWLKTAVNATTDQIASKQQEIQVKSQELLQGTGESVPAVTTPDSAVKAEKRVAEKQQLVKKEEDADNNTFQLKRLLKETYSTAVKVIGSLFIVMLFLVSGMLTANDAIGRDTQYRILYFIYGGLGFPFMLIYYLYRWFFGSAPHIYRLLPLYTKESDTTIGRFFLFPFTYKEDQAAIDAKTKFMTEAANLVGKEYKPPAEKLGNSLGSLVEGLQSLVLNVGANAKKGTNTILQGIQKLELPH